ncbi:MAG TPA: NADH-quinone oxidoreductase subunit C [Gammaproteobacteria bacterium]|nr:NADH-quinone oxidoreductase subunit C [Gammaproteobacteria bacterium]
MDYAALNLKTETLPGTAPVRRAVVTPDQLVTTCRTVREAGGLLLSLWTADERDRAGGFRLSVALQDDAGLLILELPLPEAAPCFPNLSEIFPAANRLQRAAYDMLGTRAEGGDTRPWLRHAAWPATYFPLRRDADAPPHPPQPERYAFVTVEGEGVHEIPVGPVHAGIIEPGHFRFSVVGEKVLRLEERLGFVHKGIEKRFESLAPAEGHVLAARVSGDSAVAFSWAYCMALESICGAAVPPRALRLRALHLERERIANHLGDLGALGNDAGFAFGLMQFSRLKEDLLRTNALVFGQRYLFDAIVPGGVARDLDEDHRHTLLTQTAVLEEEVRKLRDIYDNHAGLQDRFIGCGRVAPDLAARLGLIGLAGRASSQAWDLRCDHPYEPYDELSVVMVTHRNGDVAARVTVRFEEIFESLRLCRAIIETLEPGAIRTPLPPPQAERLGIGWVEGWRGPVLVALETADGGRIRRCHPHDPSWQNWPALEHAVIGNIVPDFPLINKSFNLSYSGQDL